jgi:DNA polymerase III gamma/tau subunit
MSALQVRYRPKSIKGIYGNSALKESLTSALSKEDKPTSFLFTGKSGCGKTTFGRVIANELCIDPINTHIYNAASTRGIDTIREIIQEAKKVPLFGGNRRIYILEECFPKGTNISTPNGNIPIETIRPGDSIFNIEGLSTVKSIFKNIVPLERIVKLHLSGNKEIVCSKDHLFLTENGWIKAIDLKNNLILTQSCDSLIDTLSQEVSKNEYVQMSNVFTDTTKQNPKYQNLWTMQKSSNRLFRMWENILFFKDLLEHQSTNKTKTLFQIMCREMAKFSRLVSCQSLYKRISQKHTNCYSQINEGKTRNLGRNKESKFRTNDEKQSFKKYNQYRKGEIYKTIEWYFEYIRRTLWRKWKRINTTTDFACQFIGMENGNQYFDWNKEKERNSTRFSFSLQNRYRKREIETGNRSGRSETQIEKIFIQRLKEGNKTQVFRVEDIEIYKRGCNEQNFSSFVTDNERSQGYSIFYDLEMEGHPSYFVEGCPVHNCHGITGTAAEALLDFLEHPPKDSFIVLTTTEPDALKVTIKRRCFQGEVKPLLHAEMSKLIAFVLKREKATISDQATNKIIEVSEGSAGQALKLLDMIIGVNDSKAMDLIESIFVNETQVIELCRLLVNINMSSADKWKKCSEILKTITGEPEANRRVIMGYFNTVLLNKPHNEDTACIAAVAGNFTENYYTSGKLGLTLSVFSSC